MPVSYTLRPDLGVVLVVYRGEVTIDDNTEAALAYRADKGFDPRMHVLIDMAGCSFPDSSFSTMLTRTTRLNRYYKARASDSRTSVYAPGDLAYGVARMYQAAVGGRRPGTHEVFRDAAAALSFVGLDPSQPETLALLRPR